MSSKGGGGGSGGIAERRLRPLWDAIDSRQYKSALKLSAALLSKHPDNAYLLVLKALVLERLGKGDEALPLCERAKQSSPTDELTLSTLQIVFQRLDRLDQATLCYEQACVKHPNNLELTTGLFNCYVREYSFLKQQQIAMKMYKEFGEERFLFWAICSIRLQVCCGKGGSTLVQLAEALMKRRIDTNELKELEALLVYISLLEQQGKHKAALEVLSSKLGDLFSLTADKLRLQGKLLLASHRYKEAAVVFKQILNSRMVKRKYGSRCMVTSQDWKNWPSSSKPKGQNVESMILNNKFWHEADGNRNALKPLWVVIRLFDREGYAMARV